VKRHILHEEAEAELVEVVEWYDDKRKGLGGEFRREFKEVLKRVRAHPKWFRMDEDGLRYASLTRFPYAIIFLELDDQVWIAAVAHHKRRPGYWLNRKPPPIG
jgi:toxin ParE1/3/4